MEGNLSAAYTVLKAAAAAGTLGSDKKFALSLMAAYAKYHELSPKQEVWFLKLAEKHNGAPKAAPAPLSSVGEFAGVYSLFAAAKSKLKFPKINLVLASGLPVVLYLAGPKSIKPGVINVTNGAKYGAVDNKWYGRVNADGSMEVGGAANGPEFTEVKSVLKALGAAPAKVAAEHAKLTGRCCFCNRHLTDEDHSTAVGFGPVCAKNFGLYDEWKNGVNLFEKLAKDAAKEVLPITLVEAFDYIKKNKENFPVIPKYKEVPTPLIPIPGIVSITGLHMLAKASEEKAVEEKVNDKIKALAAGLEKQILPAKALISPAKAAKVSKAAIVAVPEPKKGEDYLF